MRTDQTQLEKLSAWMDADAPGRGESLARSLLTNSELEQAWDRYHLIGDVMRSEMTDIDHGSLTAAIRARLVDEPAILAPRNIPSSSTGGWARWAAGMGMAASVAALVIIGVTLVQQPQQAGLVTVADPPAATETISAHSSEAALQSGMDAPRIRSKINRYLSDHSKFVASGGSLNGMMPLVTLVSFDE